MSEWSGKVTCILHPTWGLILGKGNKTVTVLVMKLHIPLSAMQYFLLSLLQIPLSQLVLSDEAISGVDINLGKQQEQSVGDVEPLFVVQVVLRIHEVFPLGLRLGGGGGVVEIEVLLLPLAVLEAALDIGDERVEGDGVVVVQRRSEGEVGPQLQPPVTLAAAFFGGVGDKQ